MAPLDESSLEVSAEELAELRRSDEIQIVDCREADEWAEGHISGARHVSLNEIPAQAETIDREQPVVLVCGAGNRSAMATEALRTAGYRAWSLEGGLRAWSEKGLELEGD